MRKSAVTVLVSIAAFLLLASLLDPPLFQLYKSLFVPKEREIQSIKDAVTLYNKVLTDLYVSDGQVLRLDDFPVRTVLKHEVYRDLDYLRAHDRLLVYDMADIKFLKVNLLGPDTAEAASYEEWNYVYRKRGDRSQSGAVKGEGLGFKYRMFKHQGSWKVADFEPVKMPAPKEKNGFKF